MNEHAAIVRLLIDRVEYRAIGRVRSMTVGGFAMQRVWCAVATVGAVGRLIPEFPHLAHVFRDAAQEGVRSTVGCLLRGAGGRASALKR